MKISSICDRICSGGTPKSTNSAYYGGDIPWLNTKEIDFNFINSTEKFITEDGLNNSSAKWVEAPAVIVAMYGATAGKVAISNIRLTTNQACCNLNVNPKIADFKFVYYALKNDYVRLSSMANGGAQQNLNAQQIKDFEIPDFPLPIQQKIAGILSSLDDKIETNRRICARLEELAQTIFHSWFIDFTPFSGSMPQDWKMGPLNDLIQIESGYAFKSDIFEKEGKYRLVTIKCVQDGYLDINGSVAIDSIPTNMPNYCLLRIGDILLSLTGNVGRIAIVNTNNLLLNQRVCKLNPKFPNCYPYIYLLFRQNFMKERLRNLSNGTAQLNLSPVQLGQEMIAIPSKSVLAKFSEATMGIFPKLIALTQESTRLAALRDTLLPKLMSGEIEVDDACCQASS